MGLLLGACVVGIALVIERCDSPKGSCYFLFGALVGGFCIILLEAIP
jgi:hypothetical protein